MSLWCINTERNRTETGTGIGTRRMVDNRSHPLSWFQCNVKLAHSFIQPIWSQSLPRFRLLPVQISHQWCCTLFLSIYIGSCSVSRKCLWKEFARCKQVFIGNEFFNIFKIVVKDFSSEKFVRCRRIFVLTELLISGTQCIQRYVRVLIQDEWSVRHIIFDKKIVTNLSDSANKKPVQ